MVKNKYMRDCRKRRKLAEKQRVKKAQRSPVERAYDRYVSVNKGDIGTKYMRKLLGSEHTREAFRMCNKKQQLFDHWQKLKDETTIQTA